MDKSLSQGPPERICRQLAFLSVLPRAVLPPHPRWYNCITPCGLLFLGLIVGDMGGGEGPFFLAPGGGQVFDWTAHLRPHHGAKGAGARKWSFQWGFAWFGPSRDQKPTLPSWGG